MSKMWKRVCIMNDLELINMIKVTTKSTIERKQEMGDKWESYKEMYYNTCLSSAEILKKLEVGVYTEAYFHIMRLVKKEPFTPHQRASLIRYGKWTSNE